MRFAGGAPTARRFVVGADSVSYGAQLPEGDSWRKRILAEVEIDPGRVHFLGQVPYNNFIKILQISSVHVYLTVPFVLSWSMLEAMAAGCLVVGSNTAPVAEVIEDGKNGLLVDFFSPDAIADRVDDVLDHPDGMAQIRARVGPIVARYELSKCLPKQLAILNDLASGRLPRKTGPGVRPGWPTGRKRPSRRTRKAK